MILKIVNKNDDGYLYFECDKFEYKNSTVHESRVQSIENRIFYLVEDNLDSDHRVKIINLENKNKIEITTNKIVYVLNDEGKTIDTIL